MALWFGIWKLKGYGGNAVKRLCPTCRETENAEHVILICSETLSWRINLTARNDRITTNNLPVKKVVIIAYCQGY
jgi:hypothetical protein